MVGRLSGQSNGHPIQCNGFRDKNDRFQKGLETDVGVFTPNLSILGSKTGTATGTNRPGFDFGRLGSCLSDLTVIVCSAMTLVIIIIGF